MNGFVGLCVLFDRQPCDVREVIRSRFELFPEILQHVSALAAGEGLIIVAPFLPLPLVERWGADGLGYSWREA